MATFLATFILLGAIVAAMAVGGIVQGKKLKGSCGGIGGQDCECSPLAARACRLRKDAA